MVAILFFFAMEQDDAFTAEASRGALVALVAVAGCGPAYAWALLRAPWWISLPVSGEGKPGKSRLDTGTGLFRAFS